MKICVVGTGYVGLVTAVTLAAKRHEVVCVDIDKAKIDRINRAESPIYEEQLPELLKSTINAKTLSATTDLKTAIQNAEMCIICVGTPSKPNGEIDLTQVENVSKQIGEALKEKKGFLSIVFRSTVVPGTTESVVIPNIEKSSGKRLIDGFSACFSPEFLREGQAVKDALAPDKLVIGREDTIAANNWKMVLGVACPIIETSIKTAELIKYASNAFLATKISFANELGNLAKMLGIDSYAVANAIGFDPRIGRHYLNSGLGFGGSCFPKDVKALIAFAKKNNYDPKLLRAAFEINDSQVERFVHLAEKKVGSLSGKLAAVLGTAFKAGTDDIRESQAIKVIGLLLSKGAKVRAYDPKALESTRKELKDEIGYASSIADCLKGAELCLICTEWPEFKIVDFSPMKSKIVLDGKHILEKKDGINYEGLCW